MNIQQINNSNTNFNGNYLLKGSWTPRMKKVATPILEKLAEGDKTIIANMQTKRTIFSKYHHFGQKLYKLELFSRNENRTLIEKIKDFFKPDKSFSIDITDHFHRAKSTENALKDRLEINDYNMRKYSHYLNINMNK